MQKILRNTSIQSKSPVVFTPAIQRMLAALAITMLFGISIMVRSMTLNQASEPPIYAAYIGQGEPILIVLSSTYCTACESITNTSNDVRMLLLDIHTIDGRTFRADYPSTYAPDFLLFDGSGAIVWHDNMPPSDEVLESITTD